MEDSIVNCEIESYSVFQNLDKSILGLNPFFKKFGFEFVCYDLEDLERDFINLFTLSSNEEFKRKLDFEGLIISLGFFQAISSDPYFRTNGLIEKEFVFLKTFKNLQISIVDNLVLLVMKDELSLITSSLIQQFRLFKQGSIVSSLEFQIDKNSREVMSRRYSSTYNVINSKMFFTEDELLEFREGFIVDFKVNELCKLAMSNFNLSYRIDDTKTKYITLMTCLESLFNQGRDQITHTVSRHLALIISKNEDEFNIEYTRTKQLYSLRSAIVHGGSIKGNIVLATIELQEKVRKSIIYCLKLNCTKKELFDKLNRAGYSKLH